MRQVVQHLLLCRPPECLVCRASISEEARRLALVARRFGVQLGSSASKPVSRACCGLTPPLCVALQPQEEAHAADQEADAARAAGPRAGGPLLPLRGLHQHPVLLLQRDAQDPGQHVRDVRAPGASTRLWPLRVGVCRDVCAPGANTRGLWPLRVGGGMQGCACSRCEHTALAAPSGSMHGCDSSLPFGGREGGACRAATTVEASWFRERDT